MVIIRAIISVLILLAATYVVVANWGCVIVSIRNKRKGIDRHHSTVPLISFIFAGAFAYPLYPFIPKWWIVIIPALDIGNWSLIISLPWVIFHQVIRKDNNENRKDTEQKDGPNTA